MKCEWTLIDDGTYETDCKEMFSISEGTPAENKMDYCCYCGKELYVNESPTCQNCNGSGEGMHPGTKCTYCKGSGVAK